MASPLATLGSQFLFYGNKSAAACPEQSRRIAHFYGWTGLSKYKPERNKLHFQLLILAGVKSCFIIRTYKCATQRQLNISSSAGSIKLIFAFLQQHGKNKLH